MTARTPYRAPLLTELGSVKQMTQVNLNPLLTAQACLALPPALQITLDNGCTLIGPGGS